MTHTARLRYVDVEVTEPQFSGADVLQPPTQLEPSIELQLGERIVGVTELIRATGLMGSYLTVVARVWITSP